MIGEIDPSECHIPKGLCVNGLEDGIGANAAFIWTEVLHIQG